MMLVPIGSAVVVLAAPIDFLMEWGRVDANAALFGLQRLANDAVRWLHAPSTMLLGRNLPQQAGLNLDQEEFLARAKIFRRSAEVAYPATVNAPWMIQGLSAMQATNLLRLGHFKPQVVKRPPALGEVGGFRR